MEKVALVTGSTNNVGKGIAEQLARDGFVVIITSRHGNEAKEIANNLVKKGMYYEVDFSDSGQISRSLLLRQENCSQIGCSCKQCCLHEKRINYGLHA